MTHPTKNEFVEQIGEAFKALGPEEAMSCMARSLCWVASQHNGKMVFDCAFASLVVTPKTATLDA